MASKDTKIYRISGQSMRVIGPADRTVMYQPPHRVPFTLVAPDFLYFTWDDNPTSSAWFGDVGTTGAWSPTSGNSAAENGSLAWLISGSQSGSAVGGWGRRLGMTTDGKAFDDNGLYVDRPSDQRVPANVYNAVMSGGFTVAFFARAPFDFGNLSQMYTSTDFKTILTIGSRASDEANCMYSFGMYWTPAGGVKLAYTTRGGAHATERAVLTGSTAVNDSGWHHYAWTISRTPTGYNDAPTDYMLYPKTASVDPPFAGLPPHTYTGASSGSRPAVLPIEVYVDGIGQQWFNENGYFGVPPGFPTPAAPLVTSASYQDLMYIGIDGYSNDTCGQFDVRDIVICSGAIVGDATLITDDVTDGDPDDEILPSEWGPIYTMKEVNQVKGYPRSSIFCTASVLATNDGLPNIIARWIHGQEPIVDKLRTYPLTVRAHTGSLSRIFNHTGYLEIDQLRYKENIGCLIGPGDQDIARLFCTGSYTIEAWLSCSNVDTNLRTVFAYGSSGTPNSTYLGRSVWFYLDNNKMFNMSVFSGSNSPETTGVFGDTTMSLNTWNHVQLSVTRHPTNVFFMTASCHINGVSAGTRVYRTSPFNGLSGSMWIGMKNHVIENHVTVTSDETAVWSGRIGHLKVWQRARSGDDALDVTVKERHFYDDKE